MLGWKPEARRAPDQPSMQEIMAEAAKFGVSATLGGSLADLCMPAPVLDIEEFRERNRARAVEIARRNAAG